MCAVATDVDEQRRATAGRSAQTVDIAFVARRSARREWFLAGAGSQLWEWRTELQLFDPAADETFDEARRQALARARVVLDVRTADGSPGDPQLIAESLAAGAVVVTDAPDGHAPFLPGVHFLVSPIEHVTDQAVALALDEPRRAALLDAGRALLAAGPPQFVDEPSRAAASQPSSRRLRHVAGRARRSVADVLRPTTAAEIAETVQLGEVVAAAKRNWLGQVAHVRALDRALAVARFGDADHDTTRDSEAWGTATADVAAVITIDERPHGLRATTDALVAASAGGPSIEVVVVDDSGDPATRALAEALVDQLPWLALRVVVRTARGGPAAAWRTGVARSRAAFVIRLTPGDEVHPSGLRVLHSALGSAPDDVVAAYGITATTTAAGATGVRGHLDWDPRLLVRERYLDTMAVIRRQALDGVDPTVPDGWELHDLWLGVAERQQRAMAVGAVIGRDASRGEHARLEEIDEVTTWRTLYERHPRLAWPS